jgi:hypothetical protein
VSTGPAGASRAAIGRLLAQADAAGVVRSDVNAEEFATLTGGLSVQLSLDPASTDDQVRRAPLLVLRALGTPDDAGHAARWDDA